MLGLRVVSIWDVLGFTMEWFWTAWHCGGRPVAGFWILEIIGWARFLGRVCPA